MSKIDPALLNKMSGNRSALQPVIVEMQPPKAPFGARANEQQAQNAVALLQTRGTAVGALSIINAAAGFANAPAIEAISADPGVVHIYEDSVVQPRKGSDKRAVYPPGQLSAVYPRVVGADKVWLQKDIGVGVTVAVLDSGISADDDLVKPNNRILAAVSFADPRDASRPDPGGHGSHVAGIIAGNGIKSDGEYVGIAPGANLVDVRVLDKNGNGRVSSVVRGVEWVLAHRAQYNIRVINMSFGAPAQRPYLTDPMSAAVEIAWQRGLVVVVAAGNGGPNGNTVDTPGIDPYAVTVGAIDDAGTLATNDDALGWFSSWGTNQGPSPKPDLVAPGRKIVSIRTPGSTLDTLYPDRIVVAKNGSTYFRLTGTSMAAPVVSGTVALLLQHQPSLTPDQVKAILTGTTQPYGPNGTPALPDPAADGSGLLDAKAATFGSASGLANRGQRPSDLLARALYPALYGQKLPWKDPNAGGVDWNNIAWDNIAWDATTWNNIAWDNIAWDNIAWDNIAWDGTSWDNIAWDNIAWDNIAWDNITLD